MCNIVADKGVARIPFGGREEVQPIELDHWKCLNNQRLPHEHECQYRAHCNHTTGLLDAEAGTG